ncbi:MAG: prepilin-type N-terminal cleavage/methylation domain-containing protein [Deltaproteobacteria bacterium]|nr:prepilin-type N-terminal cleavage/methylation domain-containing protein [Deltaproteobacteria bacterium]
MRQNKGFSLVELMIVVAIIGILAAIAIPNFVAMQYKAKRAEVPSNVDGIKTAEIAYEAQFDSFISASEAPSGGGNKAPTTWAGGSGFDTLGWAPDGSVRGVYSVTAATDSFTVQGWCDVDGDGDKVTYQAIHAGVGGGSTNATLLDANDGQVY